MVHPVTGETIPSYKKAMEDPVTAEIWKTASGKEFGGMTQGDDKTETTGTNAMFYHPMGVTVDSSGNVYVADHANHRIRKITSSGVVTTLAGSGSAGYVDGIGSNAMFNAPYGVAVDVRSGGLFIADASNHMIKLSSSTGVVTVFAGFIVKNEHSPS
jgi:hypothetical protein